VGDGFLCFFSGPDHADRALRAALHAKKVVRQSDLVITLNAGNIYLGLVGHPQYAVRDIMGEAVNRAFLMAGWVSRHCVSGIGFTESVAALLTQPYRATHHEGVKIELLEEVLDIYEIEIPH
jgi:class 3 adenylate cyclase